MVNLSERLRTLRTEKKITQTEMSQRLGISTIMISSYELEKRQPSYAVLIKLAAFFGVTADYLLGIERERTVNVAGLSDKEVEIINSMVEALRKK
jgi:transcriptional regulator with XRE-family HTH domain